ncbi:MAG: peptidoglycan DD-metalloendopeptidase family protein [Firmicutes bacterium]|nr:peptidoglycan DD-metalloendopeptidase family protein [Bacillota bacterium]
MYKKKYFAFFMILLALVMIMPTIEISASQAVLRERRERLREVEQRRDAQRNQVREAETLLRGHRAEIENLLQRMRDYSQRMIDAHADLEEIEYTLLQTEIRQIYAIEELEQARIDRDIKEEIFHARLRAMHEGGTAGHLSVLFQANTFTEFLLGLEQIRDIAKFDQQVLNNMQEAEARVEEKIDQLSRVTTAFEITYQQQQIAIEEMYAAIEANTQFLYSLQQDEAQAALLLEIEEITLRSLEEEFGVAQRLMREAESAEQARQEQERIAQELAQRAAAQTNTNFGGTFAWPVPGHARISSHFGTRTHPIRRTREHHSGIDIPAPGGTRIIAAEAGVVTLAQWHGGFGLTVIIDHGNGYSTLYAHNFRNRVSVGQRVTRGQHIADVGTTGVSTGNHLHFEVRRNGVPVNPLPYVGR